MCAQTLGQRGGCKLKLYAALSSAVKASGKKLPQLQCLCRERTRSFGNTLARGTDVCSRALKAKDWRYSLSASVLHVSASFDSLSFHFGAKYLNEQTRAPRRSFLRFRVLRGWGAPLPLTCRHVHLSRAAPTFAQSLAKCGDNVFWRSGPFC